MFSVLPGHLHLLWRQSPNTTWWWHDFYGHLQVDRFFEPFNPRCFWRSDVLWIFAIQWSSNNTKSKSLHQQNKGNFWQFIRPAIRLHRQQMDFSNASWRSWNGKILIIDFKKLKEKFKKKFLQKIKKNYIEKIFRRFFIFLWIGWT